MADAWNENAQSVLTSAIAGVLGEKAPFIRGWVLALSYIDDDGALAFAFNCNEESRRSETMGLLAYAQAVEQAGLIADELADRL